jgi:hypothetical protein
VCAEQDLTGLIHHRLANGRQGGDWPKDARRELARNAHADAARELLRMREIVSVLDALATNGIQSILLKGTPLAYTIYDAPALRPRSDTDLMVPREQIESIRRVMAALGYTAPTFCEGAQVFCQFELAKADRFGVDHAFDFHWKISTQSIFSNILSYSELAARAVPVPRLGSNARAAGAVHALLLACMHPVMHHRNVERMIWIHDVHLLTSRLSTTELNELVDLAIAKRIATLCAHQLRLASSRFGTVLPDGLVSRLAASGVGEPSARYLQTDRRWHDELVSCLRGLPGWRDRVQLLREVLFPSPRYMLAAYGASTGTAVTALLPALYAHRIVHGAWKVLVGRK